MARSWHHSEDPQIRCAAPAGEVGVAGNERRNSDPFGDDHRIVVPDDLSSVNKGNFSVRLVDVGVDRLIDVGSSPLAKSDRPAGTREIVEILSASLRKMDGIHDMGGMAGFGPVDVSEEASGHEGWEARLQAAALLSGGMSRPGIEAIPPAEYLASGYAEKWLVCSEQRLLGDGVVDRARLDHWRLELSGDPSRIPPRRDAPEAVPGLVAMLTTTPLMSEVTAPRFGVGDRVRVRRMRPEGHHRCPRYVRGAIGVVERVPGGEHQPPVHPGGDVGQFEAVYTVQFDSSELWGDQRGEGEFVFDLLIDLWESYLEAP